MNNPKTVLEAIDILFRDLKVEDINAILSYPPETFHHTVGRHLRNSWHLHDNKSPIALDFKSRFKLFGHGDDISGIILAGVDAKVRGQDVNERIEKVAKSYREHWTNHGIDPLTGNQTKALASEITILINDLGERKVYPGHWVFERSSGYAGFRCTKCGTWVYDGQALACLCP